jgi:hypothetical protein
VTVVHGIILALRAHYRCSELGKGTSSYLSADIKRPRRTAAGAEELVGGAGALIVWMTSRPWTCRGNMLEELGYRSPKFIAVPRRRTLP